MKKARSGLADLRVFKKYRIQRSMKTYRSRYSIWFDESDEPHRQKEKAPSIGASKGMSGSQQFRVEQKLNVADRKSDI